MHMLRFVVQSASNFPVEHCALCNYNESCNPSVVVSDAVTGEKRVYGHRHRHFVGRLGAIETSWRHSFGIRALKHEGRNLSVEFAFRRFRPWAGGRQLRFSVFG
jgi:hypothetical protein